MINVTEVHFVSTFFHLRLFLYTLRSWSHNDRSGHTPKSLVTRDEFTV